MGAAASMKVEAQLATGVWTDLTADTVAAAGTRLAYGIQGNGPLDRTASTGECQFTLRNDAGNSVSTQGAYSPAHGSKRSGWTFGIPARVVFATGSTASVTSITRSSSTATVTTSGAHGLATGEYVTIAGATQTDYNGTFQITVSSATVFTYTVSNSPATPATGTITWIQAFVKFRGKVRVISPEAGAYRSQRVLVTAYDAIRDLAEADAREVEVQVDQTEVQLLTTLLDAMPTDAQPPARDFDGAVDTYPYAFDDLGSGAKVLAVAADLTISAFGMLFCKGDGTLCYRNRGTTAVATSQYTFTNTMHGLGVPSSLDGCFNRVRVTSHPKTISAAATEEIYTLPDGSTIELAAGESREVWTDYSDPNDRNVSVGGLEVVTTLVGGTHYSANTLADGTGSDETANLDVTLTPFASTAKWEFTNNASTTVFVTTLKAIGKAVRDPGQQTVESYIASSYGDRPISIDLPYQDDQYTTQSIADYVKTQYNALTHQIESLEFLANDSSALMAQALEREPGDRITVSETVTGMSSVQALIQRVELSVSAGNQIVCRWGLAPSTASTSWQLGVAGYSELGDTTTLGF